MLAHKDTHVIKKHWPFIVWLLLLAGTIYLMTRVPLV